MNSHFEFRSFCVFTILCVGTEDYAVCKTDLRKETQRLSATLRPRPAGPLLNTNHSLKLHTSLAIRARLSNSI